MISAGLRLFRKMVLIGHPVLTGDHRSPLRNLSCIIVGATCGRPHRQARTIQAYKECPYRFCRTVPITIVGANCVRPRAVTDRPYEFYQTLPLGGYHPPTKTPPGNRGEFFSMGYGFFPKIRITRPMNTMPSPSPT